MSDFHHEPLLQHGSDDVKQRASKLEWFQEALDRYFLVSERGSTLSGEFRAGTTAFLATANNFVVNAQIMKHAGVPAHVSVVSGAFASAVGCITSGILSNLPLGLVTSVGPNVYIAYGLVAGEKYSPEAAFAIAAASGVVLLVISMTPLLFFVLAIIPLSVKYGLVVGTGLLGAFIALKSIGIIAGDVGVHGNIVALGDLHSLEAYIFFAFLVVTASLLHNAVKGAVLMGMLGATITFMAFSGEWPTSAIATHGLTMHSLDLSTFLSMKSWTDMSGILIMLLFSLSGAIIGCARMAGLLENGGVPGATAVYMSCGFATAISATLGSSPVFVSMSAAAGIRDGGRTGLVSIVIGIYALLTALFFSPLASAIPSCATAPVLVLVGVSMAGETQEVRWWNMQEALPAFMCAIFQPFTYSVSNGIYAGCGMALVLFVTTGAFIQYLPPDLRRKWSSDETAGADAEVKKSIHEVKEALVQQAGGDWHTIDSARPSVVLDPSVNGTNLHRLVGMERQVSDDPGGLRGAIRALQPRSRAINLLAHVGVMLGFDEQTVKRNLRLKLGEGGARHVECHPVGGIPGKEVQLALEEIGGQDADWMDVGAEYDFSSKHKTPNAFGLASFARQRRLRRQSISTEQKDDENLRVQRSRSTNFSGEASADKIIDWRRAVSDL